MLKIGDYVAYGLTGICKVEDIKEEHFLNYQPQSFYILTPVFSKQMTIKIPVLSAHDKIRDVHSKEEAEQLIQQIPNWDLLWINDDRERNQCFRELLRNSECDDWMTLVKTIYSYKHLPEFKGKRLNKNDDEVFKMAEKLLNEELGFILNLNPDDIPAYIEQCIA